MLDVVPPAEHETEWGWNGEAQYGCRGSGRKVTASLWVWWVQQGAAMRILLWEQGRLWKGEEVGRVLGSTLEMHDDEGQWPWQDVKKVARNSESVARQLIRQGRTHEAAQVALGRSLGVGTTTEEREQLHALAAVKQVFGIGRLQWRWFCLWTWGSGQVQVAESVAILRRRSELQRRAQQG